MTEAFGSDWEGLREGFDAAARGAELAADLAREVPARPRILNIGAGTGDMLRWLAPRLGRAQSWLLADDDETLVAEAFERTEAWAARRGWAVTFPGRAMLVHTPAGAWRIGGFAVDLAAAPVGLPLDRIDAVVCSGLLDRVPRAWLDRLLGALSVPFLASLISDGRMAWLPRHPADRMIRAGVNCVQWRDSEFPHPLGADAPNAAVRSLHARGFAVRSAPSTLRLPASELTATRAFVLLAARAARAAFPRKHEQIAAWETARLRQALAARLAVRIGHRDILGLPRMPRT